jgi:glyoxylase-like metal-dependent hydrolase (beta-lactamase superfamily II)
MSTAIQISEHIYLVGSGEIGLSEEHDAHIYMVDAGERCWLVDSGAGIRTETLIDNIQAVQRGRPVTDLFITHCHADHSGGASALQSQFGLRIGAGPLTAERLSKGVDADLGLDVARDEGIYPADYVFNPPQQVDIYASGSQLSIGHSRLTMIVTPGHSADSVCYLVELTEGITLFSGDTLFASGLLPLLNTFDSELAAFRGAIQKLAQLHSEILCPGHGLFLLKGAQRLAQQVAERLARSIYIPPVISA